MTPDPRTGARAVIAAWLAAGALAVLAGPAQAADYRFWSFWQRQGSGWALAPLGPAEVRPADGAVEGWRFGISTAQAGPAAPGGAADFAVICAGTGAAAGTKRLAIVLDFGSPGDAPDGETPPQEHTACAQLPPDATAADALAAVAKPLRFEAGLLCAIAGYPRSGCGDQVTATAQPAPPPDPTTSAAPQPHPAGPSPAQAAWLTVLIALAATSLWRARRRGLGPDIP